MELKLLSLLLLISCISKQTECSNNILIDSKLKINCRTNENISLSLLRAYKDKAANMTQFSVYNCIPMHFVDIFETLETCQNGKSKLLHLDDIANLEARHLLALDTCDVHKLSVNFFRQKFPNIDLFATMPKLKELIIEVFEPNRLPDLSKLIELEALQIKTDKVEEYVMSKLRYVIKHVLF